MGDRTRSALTKASVTALLAIGLATAHVEAQTYPDKPIRLVVPSAPGGPTDVPARLLADILPKLGQPVVVENRPGAGGATGARSVATATADGYTLLVGNTSVLAVQPAVSARAGYDPVKQLAPIAKVSESYQILVTHPSLAARNVKDLIAYAKANPGKLNYAHTGPGGLPHLTAELFRAATGVDIVGVPYKSGGEAVTGVLSNQVHLTFEGITILLPQIRDGKLIALGVTSRSRTPLAPDLPTLHEAGVPDYEVTTFNGVLAPAATPPEIVKLLNATINEGLAKPQVKELIGKLGAEITPMTPEAFGAFIAAQFSKWKAVAETARIKID